MPAMQRPETESIRCWLLGVCLLLGMGLGQAGERGVPRSEGIGNFGKVDGRVYRGAQPDPGGMESLRRLGIRAIINLRQTNDIWKPEEAEARAHGLAYTNIPMAGLGRPTEAHVRTVIELIDRLPTPVFIHCEHGCDRTGTVIACYRIHRAGWAVPAAQTEADRYGMSAFEWGMRRFIADFAKAEPQAELYSPLGPPSAGLGESAVQRPEAPRP